jgi:hypothetical protein
LQPGPSVSWTQDVRQRKQRPVDPGLKAEVRRRKR